MRFDLDALATDWRCARSSRARRCMLPLDTIDEDPEQPRQEFDLERCSELAADHQRARRAQADLGAAASAAGRALDAELRRAAAARVQAGRAGARSRPSSTRRPTSYDQVIENEQREGLKPLELALFVQRRLAAAKARPRSPAQLGKSRAVRDLCHGADRCAGLADGGLPRRALPRHATSCTSCVAFMTPSRRSLSNGWAATATVTGRPAGAETPSATAAALPAPP